MSEMAELSVDQLRIGGRYKWINQHERLIYLGDFNGWHQFSKAERPDQVWCELSQYDVHMLEERIVNAKNGDKVQYWRCFGERSLTFVGMAYNLRFGNDCVLVNDEGGVVPASFSGVELFIDGPQQS